MAFLKIDPVEATTSNHNKVIITGVDPLSSNCLNGAYWVGIDGPFGASWDEYGLISNNDSNYNIDIEDDNLRDLIALVKHLRVK